MSLAPYPAGLLRRLAGAVYDLFVLVGVWIVSVLILLPFTQGQAIAAGSHWFQAYLLFLPYLLFGWFWTHGGQTPGMKAWRLRVRTNTGLPVEWGRASLRFIAAWLAWFSLLGILWILVDARRRGWQDLLSGTEVVVIPKPGS